MNPDQAVNEAFETVGCMLDPVHDLQTLAADIDDKKLSRLIEELRMTVVWTGNHLAGLRAKQR